jgi:hypothetical protein
VPEHLSCDASGGVDLQSHVCLLKDTPVLVLYTILEKTRELFVLLVIWI